MQDQNIPTEAEWAWLAGLFEGEGTIVWGGNHSVRLAIKMADRDVLETVNRLVPSYSGVRLVMESKNPNHRSHYYWARESRDGVQQFLVGVLPWLHGRRGTKAREALERLESNRGSSRGKKHCLRGHPLSGDNLYISPGKGARSCRECQRTAAKRYQERRRKAMK